MKAAAALLLTLGLAACGGSYMDTKHAQKPEPVPTDKDADWRDYGKMQDVEIKVSYTSIGHVDRFGPKDYVYVWVWRAFQKDQETQEGESYRNEYARFALDCSASTMASIGVEYRDKDDERTARRDIPGYQWDFEPVTKETYMQDFFNQVCKLARDKANGVPADGGDDKPADTPDSKSGAQDAQPDTKR